MAVVRHQRAKEFMKGAGVRKLKEMMRRMQDGSTARAFEQWNRVVAWLRAMERLERWLGAHPAVDAEAAPVHPSWLQQADN